jgi:hypothetical protein
VDINEGLRLLLDNRLQGRYPRSGEVLTFGQYARALEAWRMQFSADQILINLHDDVVRSPNSVAEKVYGHLGVDPGYVPQALLRRHMPGITSTVRLRYLALVRPLTETFFADGTRSRPRNLPVQKTLHGFDKFILARLFPGTPPHLEMDVREALVDYYREDVRELERLLQRDLTSWGMS